MGLSVYSLPLCHIVARQTAEVSSSAVPFCKGGDAEANLSMKYIRNNIAKVCLVF